MPNFTIALAGSTAHTVQIADALLASGNLTVPWVMTPTPRLIGRKQVLTKNPLHLWAEAQGVPIIFVEKKIDDSIKTAVTTNAAGKPDFLLVVDFGYLVPGWLLNWPKIAPLNIHPSLLPRWRGSSPGQFTLLYGEKESAVTLMKMGEGLDTGPIIFQLPLPVDPNWTQTEYYFESFARMGQVVAEKISAFAEGTLPAVEQPSASPTEIARRLNREDGFVNWVDLEAAQAGRPPAFPTENPTSPLLQTVFATQPNWPAVLAQASRALAPWPGLWSISPVEQGQKRLKIHLARVTSNGKLQLERTQWEGQ